MYKKVAIDKININITALKLLKLSVPEHHLELYNLVLDGNMQLLSELNNTKSLDSNMNANILKCYNDTNNFIKALRKQSTNMN